MSRRCPRLLALMAVTSLVGGCGLLGGQPPSDAPTIGELETGRITVAVLPTVEIAPLMLAIEEGWFAAAGLDIQVETAGSGPGHHRRDRGRRLRHRLQQLRAVCRRAGQAGSRFAHRYRQLLRRAQHGHAGDGA